MSDKSSIILRYDLIDKDRGDKEYKGVICNHYRGYDPYGMVSRFAGGLSYFLTAIKDLRRIYGSVEKDLTYQKFRRMFDTDFVHPNLHVSIDGVERAKKAIADGTNTREEFNDILLWEDVDYGQLLVDISGSFENYTVKYAYISCVYKTEENYPVDAYIEWNKIEKADTLRDAVDYIAETSAFMTPKEIRAFVEADFYEYAFFNELEEKCEADRPITDEDDIGELGLSVRAYSSLRRSGISTVGQLKVIADEDLRNYRNMSNKAFEEIKERLRELD